MKLEIKNIEVGARSETGLVREENQDRMSGTDVPLGRLYIVADGMGGHKGGAQAAQMAVEELSREMKQAVATDSVEQVIRNAFRTANAAIYQKAHSGDPTCAGMGTTVVLILITGRVARIAHVGDSRAYLYRVDVLTQLTNDHTMVQKMVQAGMLKAEDAADHPDASVLERAVGTRESVDVEIRQELPLLDGDVILLCSDGLSGYASNQEIESTLRSPATAQEITGRLIDLALQKGGKDNVTVQCIQFGPTKAQPVVAPPNQENAATKAASSSGNPGQPILRGGAPAVESTKMDSPPPVSAAKTRISSFHTIAAFVLGVAISASGFYVVPFFERKDSSQPEAKPQSNLASGSDTSIQQKKISSDSQLLQRVDDLTKKLKASEDSLKDAQKTIATLNDKLNKYQAVTVSQPDKKKPVKDLIGDRKPPKSAGDPSPVPKQKSPEPKPEPPTTAETKVSTPGTTTAPVPGLIIKTPDDIKQKPTTDPAKQEKSTANETTIQSKESTKAPATEKSGETPLEKQ